LSLFEGPSYPDNGYDADHDGSRGDEHGKLLPEVEATSKEGQVKNNEGQPTEKGNDGPYDS
jgi:hypothetical protein